MKRPQNGDIMAKDLTGIYNKKALARKNFEEPGNGGRGGNRTLTTLRSPDFESGASTSSATRP